MSKDRPAPARNDAAGEAPDAAVADASSAGNGGGSDDGRAGAAGSGASGRTDASASGGVDENDAGSGGSRATAADTGGGTEKRGSGGGKRGGKPGGAKRGGGKAGSGAESRGSSGGDVGAGGAPGTAAGPEGASASTVALALRALAPPRHGRTFWTDLDERLADEPQLRLAPRSAIRPITQPPPVIDDRNLASNLQGAAVPAGRSSRRTVVAVVVALLVLLLVLAVVQGPDDTTATSDGETGTTNGRAPTSEEAAPQETASETTRPPGTIDPKAPLTPAGVGPLAIGATVAELQAAGVNVQVDQQMYDSSGGTCYEAKVPGSLDLELRFRAPDGQAQANEPADGVLTSVAIESGLPTSRGAESGLVLGSPQDQVLAAYAGRLDERAHPFVSGGRIFRADAGNGRGIAFFTDGQGVIRISVGEMDAIRFLNQCR